MRKSLLAMFLLCSVPSLLSAQSLEGVWLGFEVEAVNGPDAGVTEFTQPRLLIFTKAHFMWAFVTTDAPRDLLPPVEETTDAQLAEAANGYASVGGTYLRDGRTIYYNRRISLIPNGMAPDVQPLVREIRTLTPTFLETESTNAEGITTVLKYRRVE